MAEHPDYDRIISVLSAMDATAIIGQTLPDLTSGIVDTQALLAISLMRSSAVIDQLEIDPQMQRPLTAMFMQAFVAGIRFQKEGGHVSE